MSKYRTAQGKIVDMSVLMAQNERTRAVGNMKVNARGDTIDDQGKIIVPVTQKVGAKYQKSVGNRSAQVKKPVKQQITPDKPAVSDKPAYSTEPVEEPMELTQEEQELEASFDEEDVEIEKIKSQEKKKK